jgi:hypothetical protein
LFAESEVKTKLERFVRKRKELMVMGLSIGGKLLFGYDRSKLENKRIHLWLMMNKTIVRTIFNWYINGLNNVKIHQLKQ